MCSCMLTNEETGLLFGMTCSAVSHIVSSMRTRMQKETDLRVEYSPCLFTTQE